MNFLPFFILLGSLLFSASADHILLTRIVTQPDAAESFSIYNPTDSPINLSNYYICDDEDYFTLQTENDPAPAHIATGFTAQFPDIDINSGDTLTIILNSSYGDFYGSDFIPDLLLYGTETNSMLETEIGSFGGASDKINDSAEMIMLFYWDGSSETPIKDVDYFIWGNSQNAIDKSNVSGYQNDTPIESQLFLGTEAETYYAYSRIGTEEIDETQTGGNGINGHNETSENFRESWEIIGLFNIGCTDPNASNYNSEAEIDDGSCLVILSFSDIINNCSYYTSDIINCDGKYDLSSESAQECPLYEQLVTTKGFIIDYFDITPFGGPHSFTIKDENGYQIDFVVWSESSSYQDGFDITQSDLSILTQPPFGLFEVQITGKLGVYCDDDEVVDINSEWQITVEYETDIIITTQYNPSDLGCTDITAPNYNSEAIIDDGSCSQLLTIPEISDGLYDGQVITTQGTISDYFDITVYNGPHAVTIEDENYNELELTIWPDYWDDTLAEYASCPYSRYEVEVTGIVNQYCKDTCDNLTTDISCNDDDDCMWDSGSCIEEDCEVKYTSQTYCEEDEDCMWNQDDGICEKDCTLESNWECSSLFRSISYETANEYDGEYYLADGFLQECSWQLEVSGISGIELLQTHEVSPHSVSFQDVLDGDYYHQSVILEGVITDYFDITTYCGPHAVTISEEATGNSLELTMWDDKWSDDLECLISPPFFTKEVQLTGFVSEYEGEAQIQVCGDIDVLNENYSYQAPIVSIKSIIDGENDNRIVECSGILVDYFDITVYNGPHALTIEDEDGYRLELSIWPNTFDISNSTFSYLLQPPYNRYSLSTMGSITEYDGEKQLSISGSNSITVTDTVNILGEEYTGLMVTIKLEAEYDDLVNVDGKLEIEDEFINDLALQLDINQNRISIVEIKRGSLILDVNIHDRSSNISIEPSNDDLLEIITEILTINGYEIQILEIEELSLNTATIKPAPFVLLPTLGETLDFTYSYPNNSRVIIRIYDLSGRFITSLVDKYYSNAGTVIRDENSSAWDGRDKLGQIVAPGTYIMHIEAMNPVTGETQTDAAPMVIGVKN